MIEGGALLFFFLLFFLFLFFWRLFFDLFDLFWTFPFSLILLKFFFGIFHFYVFKGNLTSRARETCFNCKTYLKFPLLWFFPKNWTKAPFIFYLSLEFFHIFVFILSEQDYFFYIFFFSFVWVFFFLLQYNQRLLILHHL